MGKSKVKVVEIDLDPANLHHNGVVVARKDSGVHLIFRTYTAEKSAVCGISDEIDINTDNPHKFIDIEFDADTTLSGIELSYSRRGEIITAHRTMRAGTKAKVAILSSGPTGAVDLRFKDGFVACNVPKDSSIIWPWTARARQA